MIRVGAALAIGLVASPAWAAPGAGAGLGAAGRAAPIFAQPAPASAVRAAGQTSPTTPPAKPLIPTDPIVARYSADYEGCMRRAGSTLDMVGCADHESDRWDARMSRAQKAWTEFRDADCAAFDEDGGSIARIDASQCVLRRTVERTLELEAFPSDHGPG